MNFYLEITLLPGTEIGLNFLWEKVYQQLHLGFVAMKDESGQVAIGVSFPNYNEESHRLGEKLRLFAETKDLLARFNAREWLAVLSDYVHLTSIKPVPEKIEKYASFYRIQPKSNYERLRRRREKRIGKANQNLPEQPLTLFPNYFYKENFGSYQEQRTKAPFINLKSASSGESFKLFIGYVAQDEASKKCFSCYGLSRQSTVPIF